MKKLFINQTIPPKSSLFQKLAPKYLDQWTIEDLNYITPYEHSNFPSKLYHGVKRIKIIRRIRFSGDLNQQSVKPISSLIKLFKKYLKEILASSFVRKNLMFLKQVNLENVSIEMNQDQDWRLLLFNKKISHLQIFMNKIKGKKNSLAIPNNSLDYRENMQSNVSNQFDKKIYQLNRLCKSLHKLNKLTLNGEYDLSMLRLLNTFDSNLNSLTSFRSLSLTISYDDTLPSHIIENTARLNILTYITDLYLKLNSTLTLLKNYLEFPYKFTNLKKLEIYSLFLAENDFSFFANFSLLPCLTDIKILLYGLNGSQSLVRFLSYMNLPDRLENFSLVIRNNLPWVLDYEKGASIQFYDHSQKSSSFTTLLQAWKNLKLLQRIQIRVHLQFRESDIYLLGEFFQIFTSLKDLDLEIGNDCEWINRERLYETPEYFNLQYLLQYMENSALQINRLNVVAPNMLIKGVQRNLEIALKGLKCLTLKSSIACDKDFVQFVKLLPNEMEKFLIDELIVKQNTELEYALEALQYLKVTKSLKLTLCLDRKIRNIEIVDGLNKLIKLFKHTDEVVFFLNNYILGNECFLKIRNEIKRIGRKLKQGVGKVSDFNCNLSWSCNDCKIFYNQLDFFSEDFY